MGLNGFGQHGPTVITASSSIKTCAKGFIQELRENEAFQELQEVNLLTRQSCQDCDTMNDKSTLNVRWNVWKVCSLTYIVCQLT